MPNPRSHFGTTVLNGEIFAIGGQYGFEASAVTQTDVHRYNSLTDTWSTVAALPTGISHNSASTFIHNGRILVVGGESAHDVQLDSVYAYEPTLDMWFLLSTLPQERSSVTGGVIDGTVYVTSGGPNFQTGTLASR
jgi:N-acetylneuraminic acid mutarotase